MGNSCHLKNDYKMMPELYNIQARYCLSHIPLEFGIMALYIYPFDLKDGMTRKQQDIKIMYIENGA